MTSFTSQKTMILQPRAFRASNHMQHEVGTWVKSVRSLVQNGGGEESGAVKVLHSRAHL
jgi:hypothetical protein